MAWHSTRRIAEAAGVNEVTLFRQFGSKESLLLEAISNASGEHPAPGLPSPPGILADEMKVWALAQHQSIREMSGIIRTCLAEWEQRPELAPKVCGGGALAYAELIRYLGQARERGQIGRAGRSRPPR